jgi:hypothetical protein
VKPRTRRAAWSLVSLACGALATGCDDPLTDPTWIAGPRIVGARVAAQNDATVAQPGAGAAATIDWLVLSDEPGTFSAKVAWCVAAPSVLGAPRCGPSVFAEASVSGELGTPLRLAFELPGELAPGSAWLSWLGVCADGEPVFDAAASRFRCPEGAALSGFYRGLLPQGAENHNPSLADDTLLLAGAEWPPAVPSGDATPPGGACRDLGLPVLRADQPASLSFELGGDDREPIESAPGAYAAHERESLVYTHLATQPGLERAFSAIDFDAAAPRFEVAFDFGAAAPGPDGQLLRLYLVVRDERGGVDWLQRDACLH